MKTFNKCIHTYVHISISIVYTDQLVLNWFLFLKTNLLYNKIYKTNIITFPLEFYYICLVLQLEFELSLKIFYAQSNLISQHFCIKY